MANYNTRVKVIINEVTTDSDSTSGSLAKEINDFMQTLDSSSGTVQDIQSVKIDRNKIAYIVWYLG